MPPKPFHGNSLPPSLPLPHKHNTSTRIIRSFIRSFVHLFIVLFIRLIIHGSFVRSFVRSFVQIFFVQSLCCRNSDRSFVRSFIIPIHRSSFVHTNYSSFVHSTIHRSLVRTIHQIVHSHYSSFIQTIHRSSFIHTDYSSYRSSYYSSLLFIDPITQIFNCSSVMMSSSSKACQTNISVIRTPMTVIFLLVRTSCLVTDPRFLQVEHA
jgi:hypothetical protein